MDGYVLAISKKNVEACRRVARKAGRIWRAQGALEYRECVGDDLNVRWGATSPERFKPKPGEAVVFVWVVFKSRAQSRSRQRER